MELVPVTDNQSLRYQQLPKSAGHEDKYLVGFLIALSLLLIVSLLQKNKAKYYSSMVVTCIFIILGLFGSGWSIGILQVDDRLLGTYTQETVTSELNVLISVRGFNVTLLDWNEHFSWSYPRWRHEVLEDHIHDALDSGVPYPIYGIAEAMAIDAEYIRWGRDFRNAGYYTWIMLWSSFTFLNVSALFMLLDQRFYSGVWLFFTSIMMIISWICWLTIRPTTFFIPLQLGWTFITTVVGSFYTLLISIVLLIVRPDKLKV